MRNAVGVVFEIRRDRENSTAAKNSRRQVLPELAMTAREINQGNIATNVGNVGHQKRTPLIHKFHRLFQGKSSLELFWLAMVRMVQDDSTENPPKTEPKD